MAESTHIKRNFGPVYDANSKILILGSFPSVKSREAAFYYGHPQNRFWPLLGKLLGCEIPKDTAGRKTFLLAHGIALWDTIEECDIIGSSDSSIKNVIPVDILQILRTAEIREIFCNGAASHKLFLKYLYPVCGRTPVKLPSTSPANAACSLDRLAEEWRVILDPLNGKELSEMTLEELWQLFPIVLTEHRDCWSDWFEEELPVLQPLLPKYTRISHIGSTAIRGIRAKPIIDILAELPEGADMQQAKAALTGHGYLCMCESAGRVSLNKGYTKHGFAERVFHIHLRYLGDNDELYFRKYLNEHPEIASEYEKLKLTLWKRFEHDRDGYTDAKRDFVLRITETAKAEYPDYY